MYRFMLLLKLYVILVFVLFDTKNYLTLVSGQEACPAALKSTDSYTYFYYIV